MRKNKFLAFVIILISISLMACSSNNQGKKEESQKGLFVEKWDNFYEGSNIKFYYESPQESNLQLLKDKYKLNEVVKDGKDDFDKSLNLMKWINTKMKYNKGSISTKEDALSILKEATGANSTFSDKDFAIVYSQVASSLGIYARRGEYRIKNSQQDGKDSYYKVCEVWSDKYSKWIMLDVVNNSYIEYGGRPLSAIEVLNIGMDNIKANGIKDLEKYIKKFKPYLYSYTIEIDNNIYGTPKSNAFISYSKGSDMPEVRIEGGLIRPTIFVKKDTLFNKSPRIEYKNDNSDKSASLIIQKKNGIEGEKEEELAINVAAFKNSGNIKDYFISVDNKPWEKISMFKTISIKEGKTNIRLSEDGKKAVKEIILQYKK
ncbi:transglutaminase domain-containing protein [Clostridium peptidivorans]|uniref:transglutaminase domain-containing protein n=1 Tax=Clostridium peptidivorans TaxID=100174 RepID=UPI001FA93A69|nr:transglutaminase domain-containing protein [Clostridium peptidivorans]